jgi:glycosyltransferase involved in cell wall biosynthesis
MNDCIVIGMPLKNNALTVTSAIESFLSQKLPLRDTLLLIANDESTDDSREIVQSFLPHPQIQLIDVKGGTAYATRNHIHHFIRKNIPNCCLIGRLDADDILADEYILRKIEERWEQTKFDVLFMGNRQKKDNQILEWVNIAFKELLDDNYLLNRLKEMSLGNKQAELPSCNTFIRPNVNLDYPAIESAEDHWFTVFLLLQKDKLNIQVAEDLIYCIYSLDGSVTHQNSKQSIYQKSRVELYQYFKQQML